MGPLLIFFFAILSTTSVAHSLDLSPYPLRKGTSWTYQTSDGSQKTTTVERLTEVRVGEDLLPAAILQRTDGTPRLVIRSTTEWMECGTVDPSRPGVSCEKPFVFFKWPLTPGEQWATAGLDFTVVGKEAIKTPALGVKEAWRITYAPAGSRDPLGDMWVLPNVGPIRFTEHENEYDLIEFQPGEGIELAAVTEDALKKTVETARKTEPPSQEIKPNKWLFFWKGYEFPWAISALSLLGLLAMTVTMVFLVRSKVKDLEVSENPELISALAACGDLSEARQRLERLILEKPNFPDLRYQLSKIYQASGDLSGAKSALIEALKLNPRFVDAQFELGKLLTATGEGRAGHEHLRSVALTRPNYADVHYECAKALIQIGDLSAARTRLERALELNPNYAEAKALISHCLAAAQVTV